MPGILERWRNLFRPTIVKLSLGPDAPAEVLNMTARALYNSQDNLAAVVNFLANSIAQLPLKVYRRDENDRRARDRTSKAAQLLWSPNNDQTEYEFIRALAIEYFIFGCVYVWILDDPASESGKQARIIPTDWVSTTEKLTGYGPDKIIVSTSEGGGMIEIPRTEFVRFATYSPGNPGGYVSPVSALRQTLEEQIQAGRFRRELWKSSGRLNAQIIRPKDVEPWEDSQRERWIKAFRESWGAGGSKAGSIPLMEDGMEIKPFQTSFKEQQWVESVKLTRESVAAAYGINPSLVWHSDSQTYASSKDNARALYAECLGPVLQMIQQKINSFLLPMVGADPGTYVEFDLTEKLKGSFEERASILQSSVGGPWLTRNEARRDNNLPPIEGGDELIVPLNVSTSTASDAVSMELAESETEKEEASEAIEEQPRLNLLKSSEPVKIEPEKTEVNTAVSEKETDEMTDILDSFFKRQAKSILPKIGAGKEWWDADRWDKELSEDLQPLLTGIAAAHGEKIAKAMDAEYITEKTVAYFAKVAGIRAEIINDETRKKIQAAIDDADEEEAIDETVAHEMEKRSGVDAALIGAMLAKTAAGWGTEEATRQAAGQGTRKKVYKVWETGPNARESHVLMDGETVLIDDTFSNGAYWPGDDSLDPDESCGCNCSTHIVIMEE